MNMTIDFKKLAMLALLLTGLGCATSPHTIDHDRITIDKSYIEKRPDWGNQTKIRWEEGAKYILKTSYTLAGTKRVNSCYDLARFEAKEALLTEVANDISGELNLASDGIDESDGNYMTKVLLESVKGDTRGLKTTDQFYERYRIDEVERIECFMLTEIKKSDFEAMKNRALAKLNNTQVPELRKALQDRQLRMISADQKQTSTQLEKINDSTKTEVVENN